MPETPNPDATLKPEEGSLRIVKIKRTYGENPKDRNVVVATNNGNTYVQLASVRQLTWYATMAMTSVEPYASGFAPHASHVPKIGTRYVNEFFNGDGATMPAETLLIGINKKPDLPTVESVFIEREHFLYGPYIDPKTAREIPGAVGVYVPLQKALSTNWKVA